MQVKLGVLHGDCRRDRDVEGQHLPFGKAAVLERAGLVPGLFQIAFGELTGVGVAFKLAHAITDELIKKGELIEVCPMIVMPAKDR